MFSRTLSAAVVAAAALASMGSIASAQSVGSDAAFSAQLNEATSAAQNRVPAGMGREEHLIVDRYLRIAEDLQRQGRTDQAQAYLNFARGELGLRNGGSAVATASRMVAR